MRAPFVAALFAVLGLAGCAADTPSPSAISSSDPVAAAPCPAIVLRTPAGANVNLTGRWRSPDGGTYYLRQSASCVWFTGLSADTDAPGGEHESNWTNSFFGYLAADFTLSGSWADLPWGRDDGVGRLTWQLNFDQVGGQEAITLEVMDSTGNFGGGFLVRPDAPTSLHGQLRETVYCPLMVADDGETYELVVLPPGWTSSVHGGLLFGPNGAEVAVGDSFDISGELARGYGSCGPGMLFFGDALTLPATP